MAPSTDILIGDSGGQYVLVRPLARSQPGLFDSWDGNWIDCEVEIAAGGFRGGFRADLRSEEFQALLEGLEALQRALTGTATFTTMEGQLAFSLVGDAHGQVQVQGEGVDATAGGNRLQFGFELDQASLVEICRSLEYLLAAYPVAITPES